MEVEVKILTDVKHKITETVPMEVEVGVAGKYEHFKSIGGRGRMVLPSNGLNGVIIDMILDQNRRTYPYHDPEWQAAAKFYAVKHMTDVLHAPMADDSAKARVTVDCFAVSPIIPLSTNLYMQEAKGLVVSLLIKGVQFENDDEADGFGLTPVPPIPLQALLLTGEVSSDGLTPTVAPSFFRIRARCFTAPCRVKEGNWLAPLLVAEAKAAAAADGSTASFDNIRTARRRLMRVANHRESQAVPKAAGGGLSEGEVSDGGASAASSSVSKLARQARNGFDIR